MFHGFRVPNVRRQLFKSAFLRLWRISRTTQMKSGGQEFSQVDIMFKVAGIRVRFIPRLAELFVGSGESTRKREENTSS